MEGMVRRAIKDMLVTKDNGGAKGRREKEALVVRMA